MEKLNVTLVGNITFPARDVQNTNLMTVTSNLSEIHQEQVGENDTSSSSQLKCRFSYRCVSKTMANVRQSRSPEKEGNLT